MSKKILKILAACGFVVFVISILLIKSLDIPKTTLSSKIDNSKTIPPSALGEDLVVRWSYPMMGKLENGKDEIDGVSVDSQGNVFMGGPFEGTVKFGETNRTAKNGIDIHVSKLTPDGEELWFMSIDSGGDDFLWDITVDNNDDILLSGGYGGTLTHNGKTFVAARDGSAYFAKLDGKTGSIKWITVAGVMGTGNELIDSGRTAGGNEIKVDSQGNAVAILSARGERYKIGNQFFTPAGVMDAFVVKLSPEGEFVWAYQFAGSGRKQGRAIAITGEDKVVVGYELIGEIQGDNGDRVVTESNRLAQGAVALLSSAGELEWLRSVTGDGFTNVRGAGGDSMGNVYITGRMTGEGEVLGVRTRGFENGSAYIAKLDSQARPLWIRVLGNDEMDNGGELISNDSYVAITGVNKGPSYHLYDQNRTLLQRDVHTVEALSHRATLTLFTTEGDLVAAFAPKETSSSNGGVLEFTKDSCLIMQIGFFGTILLQNGDIYTTVTGNRTRQPDRDSLITKLCY